MTDFNLPCKALQEARSTSWGIKAHSRRSSNFKLSSESWGVLQTLLFRIDNTEKSRGIKSGLLEPGFISPDQIRANEPWNVGLNPALSHFGAMLRSGVLLKTPRCTIKVITCPGKQFSFQNVRNLTLAVQFHSEVTKTSGDLPVAVIAAHTTTESWFWRRLTLLPATDPSQLQTLSFWWFRHCWKSNFFSSLNTKLGTIPFFMRFRMCWQQSSLIRSWVVESSCLFWIL